ARGVAVLQILRALGERSGKHRKDLVGGELGRVNGGMAGLWAVMPCKDQRNACPPTPTRADDGSGDETTGMAAQPLDTHFAGQGM
ncbi:hypothetical protein ACFQX4_19740, partial [Roseomonas sp. GCM10028921]